MLDHTHTHTHTHTDTVYKVLCAELDEIVEQSL